MRRMARPVRNLWRIRTVVRRRHRTWTLSMCLATIGWAAWWFMAVTRRLVPSIAPDPTWTAWVGGFFGVLGMLAALASIRARPAWMLLTIVPLFANGTLLGAPLVRETLMALKQRHVVEAGDERATPPDAVERGR
jgi:hypothetical protein